LRVWADGWGVVRSGGVPIMQVRQQQVQQQLTARMHQGVGIILTHHATSSLRLWRAMLMSHALPANINGVRIIMNQSQSSVHDLKAFGEALTQAAIGCE